MTLPLSKGVLGYISTTLSKSFICSPSDTFTNCFQFLSSWVKFNHFVRWAQKCLDHHWVGSRPPSVNHRRRATNTNMPEKKKESTSADSLAELNIKLVDRIRLLEQEMEKIIKKVERYFNTAKTTKEGYKTHWNSWNSPFSLPQELKQSTRFKRNCEH